MLEALAPEVLDAHTTKTTVCSNTADKEMTAPTPY